MREDFFNFLNGRDNSSLRTDRSRYLEALILTVHVVPRALPLKVMVFSEQLENIVGT